MNVNILLRQIHHWGSILIALPLLVIIGAGLLLMLKKDVDWIQPPTQRGGDPLSVPESRIDHLFAAVAALPEAGMGKWSDLDRVDIKPDKGIVKFIGHNRREVQLDLHTAEVLLVASRRSDLIESLHDGSFFAGWTKHYLFLPAGAVLLFLWLTGLWLFFLPHVKRWRRRRARRG